MPMREYSAIFATDEPFRGWRMAYDEEDGFEIREYEARLPMSADKIFANLDTPSGVQVMFAHDQFRQSVGRISSIVFNDGKMQGIIELSEKDLESAIAGGFDALESGVNNGLSVGLTFLENPPIKFEKRKDKPDKATFGKMELREVSLTSIPRLKQAGIVRRMGGAEPEPQMAEEPEDGDRIDP